MCGRAYSNYTTEELYFQFLNEKPILQRRCIIPGSGFFEWKKEGTAKRPFKIFLKNQPIMPLAGIWTSWRAGTPEEQRSFSIMTTAANSFMEKIHDRMPVILDKKQFDESLDPEVHEAEQIGAMLKPCHSKWLDSTEVSTLVNSTKNYRAEVLEPVR
jgi:putative SOS response-associated peptidase YedK